MDEQKGFAQNTSILISGEIISFLLAFGLNFFLVRILTIDSYSLFNRILIVPTILLYLTDFGFSNGCVYYITRLDKLNKKQQSKNVIKITIISKFIIGIVMFIFIFLLSPSLISPVIGIQKSPEIFMLQIIAILIITNHFLEAIRMVLIASNKMIALTLLKITENGLNLFLTILFFIISWGLFSPIMGLVFSTLITGIFGILFTYKKLLKPVESKKGLDWKCAPILIKRGFMYSLNGAIINSKDQLFILFLTLLSFYSEVSYFRVGLSIAALFYLILRPVKTSIYPIFTKYTWNNPDNKKMLIQIYHYSIKFCLIFITPVIIFFVFFAYNIIPLIFGMKYSVGTQFISIYFISYLPLSIGMGTLSAFFYGQGFRNLSFLIDFFPFILSSILGIIFSVLFGSLGFAIGLSLGSILGFAFDIILSNKKFGKILFSKSLELIYLIVIVFGLCGFFFILFRFFQLDFIINNTYLKLIAVFITFICFYFFYVIISIRVNLIKYIEIEYFVNVFNKIPMVNKILPYIAKFAYKLSKKNNSESSN